MAITEEILPQLGCRFAVLLPHLNERQRRLAVAAEARLLGYGWVCAAARAAAVSETTVRRGITELEAGTGPLPGGRIRIEGGGRKPADEIDPALANALMALVEPDERGDPESPLRWTTKSLRHLAEELTQQGHPVSAPTVGRLLKQAGFSLQANAKVLEGAQHPDREAQFRYLNEQVKQHQGAGEPVISVDTKKREQLGRLPMAGREWRPKGDPVQVEDHHFFFSGPDVEQAIPYGIYDIARNTGWVSVGVDHDTATFAVPAALATDGVKCWADKAYQGAGAAVRVPFRGKNLRGWRRRHNRDHAKIRSLGERAMATLKCWRLLRKLRCSTTRITAVVRAVGALELAN